MIWWMKFLMMRFFLITIKKDTISIYIFTHIFMNTKKLQHILNVLRDWVQSIYLYQREKETIPVFIVNEVNFVSLNAIRSFFVHEKFILLTEDDIKEWNDVFCLKLLHIKNHSTLFYGNDILFDFTITLSDLRSALEFEIRNKRIQLREEYLSHRNGRDFLKHILPGMQILREWALFLKSPDITLPDDMKVLLSLFDVAWSCNSQIFYYLIEDRIEDRNIPLLIHDVHQYLFQLCTKVNCFTL